MNRRELLLAGLAGTSLMGLPRLALAGPPADYPKVRLGQCRGVVDAITEVSHDMAAALEGQQHPVLLRRRDTREHRGLLGDMPQSWAAAECVRFLRHMLVLEDDKTLRLFNGVSEADIAHGKPIALRSTPTRFGRVSVSMEPVDAKTWTMKFQREPLDEPFMPPLTYVTIPLRLPGNLQIDKFSGPNLIKNSPVAMIDPTLLSWEMTWKNFRRS